MPLSTFASCPTCRRDVEVSDLPAPLLERVASGAKITRCARCGGVMLISHLWPALLAMPVTAIDARLMTRRGAA